MLRSVRAILACVSSAAALSCYGGVGSNDAAPGGDETGGTGGVATAGTGEESGSGSDSGTPTEDPPDVSLVGRVGLRRLTIDELDATIRDLVGDDTRPARAFVPEDLATPFDNDYTTQVASQALIDGAESLARDVAARLVADPQRRAEVVGCTPTGPDDAACMESFVRSFGRRALRRPLADDEVVAFASLISYAEETGDFWAGAEAAFAAFLQHPEFLYRVEIGEPVEGEPGLHRLGPFETVTRLSYFLWGTMPSDDLLDEAQLALDEGRRLDPADVRALAEQMLEDDRARAQVDRFHALWLGYRNLPYEDALAVPMRAETRALLDRVVFEEQRPWRDIFTADETFVTPSLAEHYGLPAPADGNGGWVAYADDPRRGLLSHGSYLSNGVTGEDTRLVMRGLAVRTRLLCGEIPPPPPNVNADDEPEGESPCKWDRYWEYREPGCIDCHQWVNPIGWGLEQYDQFGRFRELDNAGCELEPHAVGEIQGLGTFRGPGELGALLAESSTVTACFGEHLYRFAVGRSELDADDRGIVTAWLEAGGEAVRLHELLLHFVSEDAFVYRREPEEEG